MRNVLVLLLLLISSCKAANSASDEYSNKYPGLKTYVIKTDGKEKITHALHPDLPVIGGWGDDTYKFNGKIIYNNKSISLEIEKYFPLCVIDYKEKEYFLGCFYFVPKRYQVYQIDNDKLQLLDPNDIPAEITFAELPDMYYSKSFKVWYMLEMLKRKDVGYVLDMFEKYLDYDERAFLLGDADVYMKTAEESNQKVRKLSLKSSNVTDVFEEIESPYSDKLSKRVQIIIDNNTKRRIYKIANRLLLSSTPHDRSQEVVQIFYYMSLVDKKQAIKSFKNHITEDFIRQVPSLDEQEYYRVRMQSLDKNSW